MGTYRLQDKCLKDDCGLRAVLPIMINFLYSTKSIVDLYFFIKMNKGKEASDCQI